MQIQPSDNWIKALDAQSSQDTQRRRVTPTDSVVNELGSGYASLVQTAIQANGFNPEAVAAAQNAIADGTLDTPEAQHAAAEALLTLGL